MNLIYLAPGYTFCYSNFGSDPRFAMLGSPQPPGFGL